MTGFWEDCRYIPEFSGQLFLAWLMLIFAWRGWLPIVTPEKMGFHKPFSVLSTLAHKSQTAFCQLLIPSESSKSPSAAGTAPGMCPAKAGSPSWLGD